MSYETIARRWARAVYDLGKEGKNLTATSRDLSAFAELYAQSDELSTVLENPLAKLLPPPPTVPCWALASLLLPPAMVPSAMYARAVAMRPRLMRCT